MEITVTGRHLPITPAIKEYATTKVGKLPRYFDRIQLIEVVADKHDSHRQTVEVIVKAEHHDPFVAKVEGPDLYACIDDCVDKLERQLTDHKEKLRQPQAPSLANGLSDGGCDVMKLADFVVKEAIVPQLKSTDRDAVIRELVDALVAAGAASKALRDDLVKLILDREKHGSTGFGKGVAVPHVKHDKIKGMAAAIGISQAGVEFNALDKAPVYSIVLLLSPKDRPNEHLQAMENIFSNLQKDTFRRFLRQATQVKDVEELIHEADTQQI